MLAYCIKNKKVYTVNSINSIPKVCCARCSPLSLSLERESERGFLSTYRTVHNIIYEAYILSPESP